jgi:hypothetical protein
MCDTGYYTGYYTAEEEEAEEGAWDTSAQQTIITITESTSMKGIVGMYIKASIAMILNISISTYQPFDLLVTLSPELKNYSNNF